VDEVRPGSLRDSQDVVGTGDGPGNLVVVIPAALGGEELGVVEKVQVVNGDHKMPGAEGRRDEIRAMKQVQA
jgi:hypothetical protein